MRLLTAPVLRQLLLFCILIRRAVKRLTQNGTKSSEKHNNCALESLKNSLDESPHNLNKRTRNLNASALLARHATSPSENLHVLQSRVGILESVLESLIRSPSGPQDNHNFHWQLKPGYTFCNKLLKGSFLKLPRI